MENLRLLAICSLGVCAHVMPNTFSKTVGMARVVHHCHSADPALDSSVSAFGSLRQTVSTRPPVGPVDQTHRLDDAPQTLVAGVSNTEQLTNTYIHSYKQIKPDGHPELNAQSMSAPMLPGGPRPGRRGGPGPSGARMPRGTPRTRTGERPGPGGAGPARGRIRAHNCWPGGSRKYPHFIKEDRGVCCKKTRRHTPI